MVAEHHDLENFPFNGDDCLPCVLATVASRLGAVHEIRHKCVWTICLSTINFVLPFCAVGLPWCVVAAVYEDQCIMAQQTVCIVGLGHPPFLSRGPAALLAGALDRVLWPNSFMFSCLAFLR